MTLKLQTDRLLPSVVPFEKRLDELHEMLYRRGGIRPVNAAIEEMTKILLLEVVRRRDPNFVIAPNLCLDDAIDPARVLASGSVDDAKAAFSAVIRHPDVAARVPGGGTQPLWPLDEPLRINRADILAEALDILRAAVCAAAGSEHGYDPLGTAFDVFLRGRYDHAGGLATHLTPHTVVTHLARLALSDLDLLGAEPNAPVVGDPCCGTGRFLLGVLREIRVDLDALDPEDPDRTRRERHLALLKRDGLFGADQSASSVAKARVNLLLHDIPHPFVFAVDDSITTDLLDPLIGRLKLILTNPPFGEAKYDDPQGIARTARLLPGVARRSRIDPALAFVVRCIDLLAPSGRLGIILPDGLVDGPVLRRALLGEGTSLPREASIEANISLPTVTFALAGTVARTSAVVIRKDRKSRSSVFVARADHVGYLKQGGASVPDPAGDDLPTIVAAALASRRGPSNRGSGYGGVVFASEEPLAAFVDFDGLTSVDPGRVDPAAVEARIALRESGGSTFASMMRPVTRRAKASARLELPFVSVLHVDDLGVVAWHEAVDYRPTTPGQLAHPNEIMVSMLNPSKLRATVVPKRYGEVLCSSEFGIFATDGDPWEVLVLLHDERVRRQLAPLGRGTSSSRRRIDAQDLLDLFSPRIDPEELAVRAATLRDSLETIADATLKVARCYAPQPNGQPPAADRPSARRITRPDSPLVGSGALG